jgi:hypothetical protein
MSGGDEVESVSFVIVEADEDQVNISPFLSSKKFPFEVLSANMGILFIGGLDKDTINDSWEGQRICFPEWNNKHVAIEDGTGWHIVIRDNDLFENQIHQKLRAWARKNLADSILSYSDLANCEIRDDEKDELNSVLLINFYGLRIENLADYLGIEI